MARRQPDKLIAAGAWTLERGHRLVLKLSGGRYPRTILGMQPVELHTIGRTSGQRRSTMLTAPICEEERVVLVASKGGYQDNPDWYKNLTADPAVEITIGDRTRSYKARTAAPEEKAELWPRIVATYKGYAGYQRNTDRDIPVVVCEPAG